MWILLLVAHKIHIVHRPTQAHIQAHLFMQKPIYMNKNQETHPTKSEKVESWHRIFEHSKLSSSNKRFVQDGFPFRDPVSSFRWLMVDSKSYKVVNASLFSSAYNKREQQYNNDGS